MHIIYLHHNGDYVAP